ncbi:MAG TPA: hypothetical protein VFG69_16675 [Nannocystaceae bacterium]|nr:hypothetical protein [Nannocystaceae bacterium]
MRRFFARIRRPLLIGSLATGTVLGFGSGFASMHHRWHSGAHHDRGPCHGRGNHGSRRGERPDPPPDGDVERG